MHRPERRLRFRPDIEGLRAIAIVMVVLYHTNWRGMGGGFYGVDVFFVLSGFLITGLIVDEITATGTLSLKNFWARRARRLLPAAAVVTLVVVIVNTAIYSLFVQIQYARTAQAFAVYGSNVLFAIRSTDYFSGLAVRDPLLHTWSLSVEEQFYLVVAPGMLLLSTVLRRRGIVAFGRTLTYVVGVASVLSLAGCLGLVSRYPIIAFYSLPSRAWEFGLGAAAFLVLPNVQRLGSRVLNGIALASLLAVILPAFVAHEGNIGPLGIMSLIPTVGTVGLILTGESAAGTWVSRLLSLSALRVVGRVSYSWYLWHWPALVYLRALAPSPSLELSFAVAALSLLPAAVMYKLVESPIRNSRYLKDNPSQSLLGALFLAVITLAVPSYLIYRANSILESPRVVKIRAAAALPRIYNNGCLVPLLKTESPRCEYGPATNDTTLVVFGDSHAAHWFPAFDSTATLRGWKIVNWTKTGCPAAAVTVTNLGRTYGECDEWRAKTIERIVQRRPTIVVVVEDKTYQVVIGDQRINPDTSDVARRHWRTGLVQTLNRLTAATDNLILLADTPQPRTDIPPCIIRYIDEPSRCDVEVARGLNLPVTQMEREAAQAVPSVAYINLNSYICDAVKCPAMKDGIIRYKDSNHLSVAFAEALTPQLSDALSGALVEIARRKK